MNVTIASIGNPAVLLRDGRNSFTIPCATREASKRLCAHINAHIALADKGREKLSMRKGEPVASVARSSGGKRTPRKATPPSA